MFLNGTFTIGFRLSPSAVISIEGLAEPGYQAAIAKAQQIAAELFEGDGDFTEVSLENVNWVRVEGGVEVEEVV